MTRPRSAHNLFSNTTRPGTAYVMTLTVCAVAATTAVSGLALRAASADRGQRVGDLASARLLAQSGIEATLQRIEDDPDWRTTFGSQLLDTGRIDAGGFQVAVLDPVDNDLTDDDTEGYRVVSRGTLGNAMATLQVDTVPISTSSRERILAANPVRFWPLDETSGYTANDLTGTNDAAHADPSALNRLFGPDGGPAPLLASNSSFAWDFHSNDLLLHAGTVMCWVYCQGNITGDQTIFAKTNNGGGEGEFVISLMGKQNTITATITGQGGATRTTWITKLDDATWTHVAVSFGPDGIQTTIDGVQTASTVDCTSNWGSPGNHDPLYIGVAPAPLFTTTDPLNGSIRDLVIFDRQLNASEVADLISTKPTGFAIDPDTWAWVID